MEDYKEENTSILSEWQRAHRKADRILTKIALSPQGWEVGFRVLSSSCGENADSSSLSSRGNTELQQQHQRQHHQWRQRRRRRPEFALYAAKTLHMAITTNFSNTVLHTSGQTFHDGVGSDAGVVSRDDNNDNKSFWRLLDTLFTSMAHLPSTFIPARSMLAKAVAASCWLGNVRNCVAKDWLRQQQQQQQL
eukprot:jgi/Bigna1/84074/fgenesh1_pg.122_\